MNRATSKSPMRMAVLISGTGRTLKNILDRIDAGWLNAEVVLVAASRSSAPGLQYAEKAALPIAIVEASEFDGEQPFSQAIFQHVGRADVDLVVLAGFFRKLTIPDDFTNRVTNIHPALIPSFCGKGFYGLRVHQAALRAGVKLSGCTVHFADNQVDHGPVILQKTVPVLDDDTPDRLSDRVFAAEREAYPEALRLIAAGRVQVEGRRVRISPA